MKFSKTNRATKALSVYIALSLLFPQSFINNAFALTGVLFRSQSLILLLQ